jgi:CheY-like chemotaxis protein/signal transduction histidine kinase/CHASE3 domain sensor protein
MLKLSFKQQVLSGFVVTLIFVLISAVSSYLSIQSLGESYRWVQHTQDVTKTASQIEIAILNSESSLRGYVLTQKPEYITPYDENINQVLPLTEKLLSLVQDNPEQLKTAENIRLYTVQKVSDMRQIVTKANAGYFDAAKAQIQTDNGLIARNKMLSYNSQLISGEQKLLEERKAEASRKSSQTVAIVGFSSLIIFILVLFLLKYIRQTFDQQKQTEREILVTNKELAELSAKNEHHNWLLSAEAKVNETMRGDLSMDDLSKNIIASICNLLDYQIGIFYLANETRRTAQIRGAFAIDSEIIDKQFVFGEGLVGEALIHKNIQVLSEVPEGYLKINSGLGNTSPRHIICMPILVDDVVIAAIEIGTTKDLKERDVEFLRAISGDIGIAVSSVIAKEELQMLFEKTQQQAEELTSQQEELRVTNEDLIHKTEELQASEEELRVQQEELQQANSELEEKAQLLQEQNISINQAKEAISLKAEELEMSSKYKSEFLANMSHELRTPLNSILILARILKENKQANLSEEQIKYAGVIQNAGTDLLSLINDILDLSKIESGNVDLIIENVKPSSVRNNIEALFSELARQKHIKFEFTISQDVPQFIVTDQARLEQVVKNLLSNAFKFTSDKGEVIVEIGVADKNVIKQNKQLANNELPPIYFAVKDSGIGISEDKQQIIFEAFQQEDGSTSRKYGGTGLGLSISRELANLLGGEIQLESKLGIGSSFTLLIPQKLAISEAPANTVKEAETAVNEILQNQTNPDIILPRTKKTKGNNRLLIVEDDENFAEILRAYAIEKGFEPIVAHTGDEGLALALSEIPDAIVLDVMLPGMDGWTILKNLKTNATTQHIPVHMMSAGDEKANKAQKEGAIGFLKKPVEKEKLDSAFDLLSKQYKYNFNNILVIEDQILQSNVLTEQLIKKGAKVYQAYTGSEARNMIAENDFDCIILDLKLPDVSGLDLLDEIKSNERTKDIPVVINTAMELDKEKIAHIMRYSQAMVLKNTKSNDRLLDEVSLFMNRLQAETPQKEPVVTRKKQQNHATTTEKALQDKTVLITDDDMRNIFALSSALQEYNINVIIATNGREALEKLDAHAEIDLVLMDIMMPEMDGYEAMRAIRAQRQFANLPVIALTAKAMKNDREKCIEAGASDYISKPVDVDKLLSMMRVWLS